ncbi:MAG TPA: hypothetical protein VN207_08260 [Ktedonobacteraceae bacterium]|nr:hypothetical protein [Ktedonobacteraceae bacterium]
MEAVNALPTDTFAKGKYDKKDMRYITIKGEQYLISKDNIYKGGYKKGTPTLSIEYNNNVSLSLKYEY